VDEKVDHWWVREAPTRTGYYWFMGRYGIVNIPLTLVEVKYETQKGEEGLTVYAMRNEWAPWLWGCDGWWNGPIVMPRVPEGLTA
jgi:hypothetical protein